MSGEDICIKDACIIMLVRSPEKGSMKTRLARALDEEAVLGLYDRFVRDLLTTLHKGRFNLRICYYPPDAGDVIAGWLGREHRYVSQRGRDLGERLANAFTDAFASGFRRVVIIGSDSPDIPVAILKDALESLETTDQSDAVIGPANDGGYYLIGFRSERFLEAVFEGIEWGTERVFARTLDIFAEAGWRVHVLPRWGDVDTMDDLKAFFDAHRADPPGALQTLDYLRTQLGWATST
jgi:uncharacterized protein